VGGKRTDTRNITPTTIVTELKSTRLLGHVSSSKAKDISPGPLSGEDIEASLFRATDAIASYYRLLLKDAFLAAQWDKGSAEGGYVGTNQGIIATIRCFKAMLWHLEVKSGIDVRNRGVEKMIADISELAAPMVAYLGGAKPEVLKRLRSQYAEAGVQASTFALLKIINGSHPDFSPPGLSDYISKTDTKVNTEAYELLSLIEMLIFENVVASLKKKFGDGYENWWHKGVKAKTQEAAMALAIQKGEYTGYEKQLHLIDLKEIIENNWDIFAPKYSMYTKPNAGKAKAMAWFDRLNKLRNTVDHPTSGGIDKEELEFLKSLFDDLSAKVPENH
jgi:DNA sulfur modification protein DndB